MKTCLMVDDSNVIRKIATRILEQMKFRAGQTAESTSRANRWPDGRGSEEAPRVCSQRQIATLPRHGYLLSFRSVSGGCP
jgi:hypothetical protein